MKLLILICIILCSFIHTQAATYENGTLEIYIADQNSEPLVTGYAQINFGASTTTTWDWKVTDAAQTGNPIKMWFNDAHVQGKITWADIPQNVGGSFQIGTNGVYGTGVMYIRKTVTDHRADIYLYFDDNYCAPAGTHDMQIYSSVIYQYFSYIKTSNGDPGRVTYHTDEFGCAFTSAPLHDLVAEHVGGGNCYFETEGLFINEYSLKFDGSTVISTINRNIAGDIMIASSFILRDANETMYYDSGISSSNVSYYHANESLYYYIEPDANDIETLIYSSIDTAPPSTQPDLITDKNTYNLDDTIHFTYSNLDSLRDGNQTYDCVFYYYSTSQDIEYLYFVGLDEDLGLYNGDGYINTSGWKPNKLYLGIIDNSITYKTNKANFISNVQLTLSINLTYGYEFIQVGSNGSYEQYNNGDTIKITYYSPIAHSIFIIDSNDDIVQVFNNMSGFDTMYYTLPFDNDNSLAYPIWNCTFNTSYDTFLVYWMDEVDYISYPDEIDEDIQETITEIKDEIKPIKDLLFGLSGIIVDDPDYDQDGIVDSDELDQWFNGVIGLVIIIAIYIFYRGFKK